MSAAAQRPACSHILAARLTGARLGAARKRCVLTLGPANGTAYPFQCMTMPQTLHTSSLPALQIQSLLAACSGMQSGGTQSNGAGGAPGAPGGGTTVGCQAQPAQPALGALLQHLANPMATGAGGLPGSTDRQGAAASAAPPTHANSRPSRSASERRQASSYNARHQQVGGVGGEGRGWAGSAWGLPVCRCRQLLAARRLGLPSGHSSVAGPACCGPLPSP